MISIYERDLAAIDGNGFVQWQPNDETRANSEDLFEQAGSNVGTEDDASGPCGGEADVVIGVEMGEEV